MSSLYVSIDHWMFLTLNTLRSLTRNMTVRTSSRLRQKPAAKRETSPTFPLPPVKKARVVKAEPASPLQSPVESRRIPVKSEALAPLGAEKTTPNNLRDRKLKLQSAQTAEGPFPQFAHPTPYECEEAHRILSSLHGAKVRPAQVIASTSRAGCGDSPSVLDALVRTILSQNTSDGNSTRAKLSMDAAYGGSDNWKEIAAGGQAKLEEAIRCGGLSVVKSKVILRILEQSNEKYGDYSLDHLHTASTEDAMQELLGFDGVGPKTASCVLLFCLQRDDFAVDTHVHRITGLLGWRPKKANREQTYQHLNRRIPDEHKYGLHILLVTHGKRCDECKAGGRNTGKCELRKAFRGALDSAKIPVNKVDEESLPAEGIKEEEALVKVE
jgi:endonuclease-3